MVREVEETELPGVGVRFSFETGERRRVSVLVHYSGRRQVFVGVPDDPDASREVLDLEEADGQIVAELLGGSRLVHDVQRLQRLGRDLALNWVQVDPGSEAAGRTIGGLDLRTRTNVTVVAVLRDGRTIPTPGPELMFEPDDTAVLIGQPEDLEQAARLLRG